RPGDGGRAREPGDVGDRGPAGWLRQAHLDPRPARPVPEDGSEREGLVLHPEQPQDRDRDGRAPSPCCLELHHPRAVWVGIRVDVVETLARAGGPSMDIVRNADGTLVVPVQQERRPAAEDGADTPSVDEAGGEEQTEARPATRVLHPGEGGYDE